MSYLKLPVAQANRLLAILGELPAKFVLEAISLIKMLEHFEEKSSEPEESNT